MTYQPAIWDEPVRGGYPDMGFLALPGLDRMMAGRKGMMPPPPIHHLFGLTPGETTERGSAFTMPASPWLQSNAGVFFAGTTALVADAPFGSAILAGVPAGVVGTTSELAMSFLRPADTSSGTLTARAALIDLGRTLGLSEARVTDDHGRLLAHGTSRYVLMKIEPVPATFEPAPYEPPASPTPDPWQRPLKEGILPPEIWRDHSSLEIFRMCMAEEVPPPPFAQLFGIQLAHAEEGSFAQRIKATEWLCSPARTIYGGIQAYLVDATMMGAISTTLPAGSAAATLDLKINFLRPGFADGRMLTVRGTVVHRGRRIAVARAEIVNEDDKQLAIATGSAMILEGRAWDPSKPIVVADESAADD